ncbi:MAG: nucleotidyltransferase family protein [Anaerolineae bacterium]
MGAPQQLISDQAILRLVILCLRGRWDDSALMAARVLTEERSLDWDTFLALAAAEGLAPLLYAVVRDEGIVPDDVARSLRQAYDANALRTTFLFHGLETVLRQLAEVGIDGVLLKGAALAKAVYGRAAVRPAVDLDLLVRPTDASGAIHVLQGLGYTRVEPEPRAGADLVYENEVMLSKPGPLDVLLEIHWSLFNSPYYQNELPLDWFWETTLRVQVGRTLARVLGPEAQILHLCGHLLLHHGGSTGPRMLWLHDVAEVIHFYEETIDWNLLLTQTEACGLVLPVKQVLNRVFEAWRVTIPDSVLGRLNALRPSDDEARVFEQMSAGQRPVAQRFWDDLVTMPGWGQRLRYAMISLFPSASYMIHRYGIRHPLLLPLYYPYRWYVGLRGMLSG